MAEIVRVLAEWARTKQLILRAYVFGSRARGTQRDNSDLDLAVELEGETHDIPECLAYSYPPGNECFRDAIETGERKHGRPTVRNVSAYS